MERKARKWRIDFNRRYLTLDRYMSGPFIRLFGIVTVASAIVFGVICLVCYFVVGWNPGEVFIQLTNPARHEFRYSALEWLPIILTNLIGLFVLNGIILTIFVNWVSNRKENHNNGNARYPYIHSKRFSVILGAHKMVARLAHSLLENVDYVLIQTKRNPEIVRKEIFAEIDDARLANNVIIYAGSRTSWHELEELGLDRAQQVYIIGEPDYIDGPSHDAVNMQCWELINRYLPEPSGRKIPCHIMFEYQSTFNAFQFTDLKLEQSKTFRFIPFSIYETWAWQVLICNKNRADNPDYIPLDGWNGLTVTSPQRVHLIVVGMSKMGIALAIEAAHIAHYPNFNNPDQGRPRTLITFIDRNARREMYFFMGRFRELFRLARWRYIQAPDSEVCPDEESWNLYDTMAQMAQRSADKRYPWHDPLNDDDLKSPYLGNYLGKDLIDIDFEFIEGDVALPSIQKYIDDAAADSDAKTTIAVCLPENSEAMSAALYFEPNVYKNACEILVWQSETGALVNAVRQGLTGAATSRFEILKPFGMLDKCDYMSYIDSMLPKLVAYAYSCLSKNSSLAEEYSKVSNLSEFRKIVENNWLDITCKGGKSVIAKRWSNIYCANSFDTKVRAFGISLTSETELSDEDTIDQIAKVEHNRWVIEQLLLGVRPVDRSFAGRIPIEDDDTRTSLKCNNMHPDLISNEMLGKSLVYDKEIAKIIPLAISIARKIENHS